MTVTGLLSRIRILPTRLSQGSSEKAAKAGVQVGAIKEKAGGIAAPPVASCGRTGKVNGALASGAVAVGGGVNPIPQRKRPECRNRVRVKKTKQNRVTMIERQ